MLLKYEFFFPKASDPPPSLLEFSRHFFQRVLFRVFNTGKHHALYLSSNLFFKKYISRHALVFYISVPSIIVSLNRYLKAPKVSICYETFFGTPCMAFQHFNVFGLHGGWWAEQPPQLVEGAQDFELPLLEGGRGVLLAAVPRAPSGGHT